MEEGKKEGMKETKKEVHAALSSLGLFGGKSRKPGDDIHVQCKGKAALLSQFVSLLTVGQVGPFQVHVFLSNLDRMTSGIPVQPISIEKTLIPIYFRSKSVNFNHWILWKPLIFEPSPSENRKFRSMSVGKS